MLVAVGLFAGQRVNLQEKYDYPFTRTSKSLFMMSSDKSAPSARVAHLEGEHHAQRTPGLLIQPQWPTWLHSGQRSQPSMRCMARAPHSGH